jgi:eukaryotic-like serine/threonine-protein kinase
MADEWYIDNGGHVDGPLSVAELRERAAKGELRPTDSVSADRQTWVPANTVNGLTFPQQKNLTETVVSDSLHTRDVLPDDSSAVPVVIVSGYQILDTLGTGACGVVYKAKQEKLNRVVALKTVLMPDKAPRDLLDRFKQEAVSLARLQHPNIVAVYDGGECERPKGQVYFAMELLAGEDIAARLKRTGPFDERTAWLIARQTAAALAHAATHGVIHRDIKPANLFLVPPPTGFPLPPDVPMVKVTDFGLALTRGGSVEGDQRQTAAGVLLGTPVYMAPEQFSGSDVDPRADIYSLGATLYHILTGEAPFDSKTVWEVMMRKSGPVPRLPPRLSPETADLVAAMMATDPNDRPADYAALIARIDMLPCLEGTFNPGGMIGASGRLSAPTISLPEVPLTCPVPPPMRRTRWVFVGAMLALTLVGAVVGIAALAGAFKRPAQTGADTKGSEPGDSGSQPPDAYLPNRTEILFDGKSVLGWNGRGLAIENDDENKPVLVVETDATRAIKVNPNFRVVLAVDCFKSNTVEVVIATTGDSPDATRWLVRMDSKAGIVFGKQTKGAFEAFAPPVPFPVAKPGQPPYLELRYERSGGRLAAWFDNAPLGRTPDTGLKTTDLSIKTIGGPIRIESAAFAELVAR